MAFRSCLTFLREAGLIVVRVPERTAGCECLQPPKLDWRLSWLARANGILPSCSKRPATVRRLPAPLLASEPVLAEACYLLRREGCDADELRSHSFAGLSTPSTISSMFIAAGCPARTILPTASMM